MPGLIPTLPYDGVVTTTRVRLKRGFTVDDLRQRVGLMCESGAGSSSNTDLVGAIVALYSDGLHTARGKHGRERVDSLSNREALILTFWRSSEACLRANDSASFQMLSENIRELCEEVRDELAYEMLYSGKARRHAGSRLTRVSTLPHAQSEAA